MMDDAGIALSAAEVHVCVSPAEIGNKVKEVLA